jgi:hypothetical protein
MYNSGSVSVTKQTVLYNTRTEMHPYHRVSTATMNNHLLLIGVV